MRYFANIICLVVLSALTLGCIKSVYDPTDKIPGVGDNPFHGLATPSADFDWSMIQSIPLTVQTFDRYNGQYNYLVEVFDKQPSEKEAKLLATGICKKGLLFEKKIVYPKGNTDQVYVQLTTPTGFQAISPVSLSSGTDNICSFDSLTVSQSISGNPVSQIPSKKVSSSYTFVVEDSFPYYGDFDFNDAVIAINLETTMKDDYVQSAIINFTFRALGATKRVGAYVSFPKMLTSDIDKVILNSYTVNSENGEFPVYVLSDDLHALFNYHGEMINTHPDLPYRSKQTRNITFTFQPNQVKDLTIDDIDFFTTVLQREGEILRTEIHQKYFTYTSKAIRYRYYSNDNFVWALLIPGEIKYPTEASFIGTAYPQILKWVNGDKGQVQWYNGEYVEKYIYSLER